MQAFFFSKLNQELFQGPGGQGAPFQGGQGAIGYNPNWNANPGYQAWPNQPQPNEQGIHHFQEKYTQIKIFILRLCNLVIPFLAGNPNQAPVQVNPQTGQPDYSAQWAEYYRSLGMHREAEMIEQQAKQGKQDLNAQQGNKSIKHLKDYKRNLCIWFLYYFIFCYENSYTIEFRPNVERQSNY